jgi:hypothetical protein
VKTSANFFCRESVEKKTPINPKVAKNVLAKFAAAGGFGFSKLFLYRQSH